MPSYDVIVVGFGAAGAFSARAALMRGRRVAIIEKYDTQLRKLALSGGGRCNFTNTAASFQTYFGNNPKFVLGAMARFSPSDMLSWAKSKKIKTIQKSPGQYFAVDGACVVCDALMCDVANADVFENTNIIDISKHNDRFFIKTVNGFFDCASVIIATGGTTFDRVGVSDFGYKIAKQFGHKIVPIRPALCGIKTNIFSAELSGISLPVAISVGREKIYDDMLFTHFGVGGPAIYRATVRDISNGIRINLTPQVDLYQYIKSQKLINGRKRMTTILDTVIPERVARFFVQDSSKNIADWRDGDIRELSARISNIEILPTELQLYSTQTAEVTRGGVDTSEISSKTMESGLCSGLYFAGEVIDIAGDLGGFNLQWAWASGHVAGTNA